MSDRTSRRCRQRRNRAPHKPTNNDSMTDTTSTTTITEPETAQADQDATTGSDSSNNEHRLTNAEISLPAIMRLHSLGHSTREIEAILGVDHSTIARRIKQVAETADYKATKADYLAFLQAKSLRHLEQKLPDMTGKDTAIAFGILGDHEYKARGITGSAAPTSITINIVQQSAEPVTIDITNDSNNDESANNA